MKRAFIPMVSLFLLFLTVSSAAAEKVFHFLPPPYPEWSSGGLELVFTDNSKVSLKADPDHCGWWLYVLPANTSGAKALIQVKATDTLMQMGAEGYSFETFQKINFDSLFSAISNSGHLYFAPENIVQKWSATFPNLARKCTYSFTGILYDSDPSLNPAFYAPLADKSTIPCQGVTKGMVLPHLNEAWKPVYNTKSECFENDSVFQNLFSSSPGLNAKSCYDLDLKVSRMGDLEHDSRSSPQGGFFPSPYKQTIAETQSEAYSTVMLGTGQGSHQLNNINATVLSSGLFPDGLNWGTSSQDFPMSPIFKYPTAQGEFADSTHPNVYDTSSWAKRTKSMQDLDFCMEIHQNFTAREGQYIYYYGDDDLWLFIDSNLVLDLGGLHYPAPGAVLLDTLSNLIAGTEHYLNIFHCNRLSQMSTFVFRTNIVFPEYSKSSLYYDRDPKTEAYIIKLLLSGSSGCDQMLESSFLGLKPLALRHTLVNAEGDTLDADPKTPGFQTTIPENKTVWGGIRTHQDSVFLDSAKMSLPPGRYRILIESLGQKGRLSITLRILDPSSIRNEIKRQPQKGQNRESAYTAHGKRLVKENDYPSPIILKK